MIQFRPATKRTSMYEYIILNVWLMPCTLPGPQRNKMVHRYTKTLDLPDCCHSSYSSYHDKSESLLWSKSSLEFPEELSDSVPLDSKLYGAGIEVVSLNESLLVSDTSVSSLLVQLPRLGSLSDIVITVST